MTQNDTSGGGNTSTPPRARNWFFTWNNYDSNSKTQLTQYFGDNQYVIGEEKGEQGTLHLQGCVMFANARKFDTLHTIFPKVHWEVTKKVAASIAYCKKEGRYITNIPPNREEQYIQYMEAEYKDVVWKPWQQQVLDIINGPVDKRKVHWFYEIDGNTGKSFLAKYIEWKYAPRS